MPQLLVSGGTIVTQDPELPVVEAMLVEDEAVIVIGGEEEIGGQAEARAARLDLGERFACPGFHRRTQSLLLLHRRRARARLPDPADAFRRADPGRARGAAARTPAGRWVLGWGYNEVFLKPSRHPTLAELDRVAPATRS